MQTTQNHFEQMTGTPVSRLIARLAIPSVVSMLVSSIYNLADTYFVSQIDREAAAAIGVVFSLMAVIQALGFTLGMGSGNYVSRLLGMKEEQKAATVVSVAFFTALLLGVVIGACGLINPVGFVALLGAGGAVRTYAAQYAVFILIAAPFMMCSFVMNNQLRAQGFATCSMVGLTAGGVLNMVLDPILIHFMGIGGAGLATMISQIISFVILLVLTMRTSGVIRVRRRCFQPSWPVYKEIFHAGLPSFCRQGLVSVSSVVLNFAAGSFGTAALAAMTIVNRVTMFIYSALIGFAQGFQPVCGFNWGAKRYDRVMQAYRFCLKVALIMLSALGVLFFLLASPLLSLFQKDEAVLAIGIAALRFQCVGMPLQAVIMMGQFLTQSIGYGGRAAVIAMGRQGLFLIPGYLILPLFMQVTGIEAAQLVSDVFTFILTLFIMRGVMKNIKELSALQSADESKEMCECSSFVHKQGIQ
ncbi:MAG: MATE family efflux transporter [Clostridiales bacterium]|nr:MATE family efflux transporter [Clostridiales bacterium]